MIKEDGTESPLPEGDTLKCLKYAPEVAFVQGKPGLTEINERVLTRKHLCVLAQILP